MPTGHHTLKPTANVHSNPGSQGHGDHEEAPCGMCTLVALSRHGFYTNVTRAPHPAIHRQQEQTSRALCPEAPRRGLSPFPNPGWLQNQRTVSPENKAAHTLTPEAPLPTSTPKPCSFLLS